MFNKFTNIVKQIVSFWFPAKIVENDFTPAQPGCTNYYLNDPSTPELSKVMPVPRPPNEFQFDVMGYLGGNVDSSLKQQAANCQVTICKSIENIQSLITKFRSPLSGWPATPKLSVMPRAGQDYNAYYDRFFLKFFYAPDPVLSKMIFTADSADIVSHELGHALLDCMRPEFWSTQCMEIWAFHEAFGDVNAMMTCMQHDEVIDKALAETGGNLRQSNTISRLAEQFGQAVYHVTGGRHGELSLCLRDAVNDFTYQKPETLPHQGRSDVLINEPHSFGRLWVAVWYDIFVGIYEDEVKKGKSQKDAVKSARDTAGMYLLKALPSAPTTVRFFDGLARAMLAVDKTRDSQYQQILNDVFTKRGILVTTLKALSNKTFDDVRSTLSAVDHVMLHSKATAVRVNKTKTIKLVDHVHNLTAMNVNGYDLTNVELVVPADHFYVFDENGNMIDEIHPSNDEVVSSAMACVQHIQTRNAVGDGPDTEWEVKNNKLLRTFIICS